MAKPSQRLRQPDGHGALALAHRGGVDGRHEHQAAARATAREVEGQLGLVSAIEIEVVAPKTDVDGHVLDGPHAHALGDLDVGGNSRPAKARPASGWHVAPGSRRASGKLPRARSGMLGFRHEWRRCSVERPHTGGVDAAPTAAAPRSPSGRAPAPPRGVPDRPAPVGWRASDPCTEADARSRQLGALPPVVTARSPFRAPRAGSASSVRCAATGCFRAGQRAAPRCDPPS